MLLLCKGSYELQWIVGDLFSCFHSSPILVHTLLWQVSNPENDFWLSPFSLAPPPTQTFLSYPGFLLSFFIFIEKYILSWFVGSSFYWYLACFTVHMQNEKQHGRGGICQELSIAAQSTAGTSGQLSLGQHRPTANRSLLKANHPSPEVPLLKSDLWAGAGFYDGIEQCHLVIFPSPIRLLECSWPTSAPSLLVGICIWWKDFHCCRRLLEILGSFVLHTL